MLKISKLINIESNFYPSYYLNLKDFCLMKIILQLIDSYCNYFKIILSLSLDLQMSLNGFMLLALNTLYPIKPFCMHWLHSLVYFSNTFSYSKFYFELWKY